MVQYIYFSAFVFSLIYLFVYLHMYVRQHGIHYIVFGVITMFSTLNYWMMSISKEAGTSLRAQECVYSGMLLIPIVLICMARDVCKVKRSHTIDVLMIFAGLLVTAVVTTEITGFFYKSYEIDSVTGLIIKDYGFAHILFYVYLVFSLVVMGYILTRFGRKEDVSLNSYLLILCSELVLLVSLFLEKIIPVDFHFDSIGMIIIEIFFLIVCRKLPLYDVGSSIIELVDNSNMMGIIIIDKNLRLLGYNDFVKKFVPEINNWRVDLKLSPDFKYYNEIKAILEKVDDENVYENTIQVGEKYYQNKAVKMRMKGRDCGYQILIFDNTDIVKYRMLLENFNDDLKNEVKRQTEQLIKVENSMVLGMAEMVESRDSSTGGHIKRTSDVIKIITDDLEARKAFSEKESMYENLIKAAPLHDLGKLAVDDAILRKPGRFTPEEYEQMKMHAEKGGEIVSKVLENNLDKDFVELATNVAHYHHERWDGTGYPDHLSGEDIPLEARIMAIADVYDALVSKRHYKESFDFEKAKSIILEGMGTQFDPQLKETFLNCVPKLEEYYSKNKDAD